LFFLGDSGYWIQIFGHNIKILFCLKEDGTCPDVRSACGEEADTGGPTNTCGEGATADVGVGASGEREHRGQPCQCYPSLPDAIAPSLASTPTFARRDTAWCHALEVRKRNIFRDTVGIGKYAKT
jgi:hypothetical protein